ncbi:MAG: LL-diaminopimelate aminotransferase [Candidatus Omnitrophota bacterium]
MEWRASRRLSKLPPYLFFEIDKAKRAARRQGRDIIDFGIGDPDQPTPRYIIDALQRASQDPANHRYALDQGMPRLRAAIVGWYKKRFNVALDADTEILPLIGSKEGIAHFPLAFINPGDCALIPDPCYPPYKSGTIFAGGVPYLLPLRQENNFLIDLKKIPSAILKKSKVLYVNYPNNPTSATCETGFYEDIVAFAKKHRLIVVSDLAYSEIYFDREKPHSLLEIEGAREVCLEFHSLSKTFNMTGWRVGWACGNRSLVQALSNVKSNIDSGIFSAIQCAGIAALEGSDSHPQAMRELYRQRRDAFVAGVRALGWDVAGPSATFYVWAKLPGRKGSIGFASELLQKADIVATPGIGFGKPGEGFIRFALTVEKNRIEEAIGRFKKIW